MTTLSLLACNPNTSFVTQCLWFITSGNPSQGHYSDHSLGFCNTAEIELEFLEVIVSCEHGDLICIAPISRKKKGPQMNRQVTLK